MKLRGRFRRRSPGRLRALPINRMIPNVLTVLALAAGMTAIRFGLEGRWDLAIGMIVVAGVFDGLDGRIARLIGGSSGFGAQLDSLSDVIAFGVAPGVLVYHFSIKALGGLGWVVALVYVVCCALRLARFNTKLDDPDMPAWGYNFFNGVPAPAGAGLAILPMIANQQFPGTVFTSPVLNAVWLVVVAALMISRIPTFAFKKMRVPQHQVPFALLGVGVLAAGGVSEPWLTLLAMGLLYVAMMPFGIRAYRRLESEAARLKAMRDGSLVEIDGERDPGAQTG
ncbi:MAG: CDP-diacylglycerol--serine O-phosphatidyltransferase [Alphaproteobacteria bacterium]